LGKILENLNKIPKYLSKNGTQHCLISNIVSNVCRKTSKDHCFGGHTRKRSANFARQLFGQVWEHLGKNALPPKNSLALTPMSLESLSQHG